MPIIIVSILLSCILFGALLYGLNRLSYDILKRRIFNARSWDLNVGCGRTDGGGINTDIVAHEAVPNLVIADPMRLPFRDKAFQSVVCSHVAEHLQDPEALMVELHRVGREITLIVPPLWDIAAAWNFLEHRWLFITFRKNYRNSLPPRILGNTCAFCGSFLLSISGNILVSGGEMLRTSLYSREKPDTVS